jgi:hypothetical protein
MVKKSECLAAAAAAAAAVDLRVGVERRERSHLGHFWQNNMADR